MLPPKKDNIYPRSIENLNAISRYYLDHLENLDTTDFLNVAESFPALSLNQIEFIAKMISECYNEFFEPNFKGVKKLSNLFLYVIDATAKNPSEVNGSVERRRITEELRDFLKKNS